KVTKAKIFDYTQEVIPINRKYNNYLDEILSDRNQKDFRIYNMSNMMSQTIENLTYETTDWLNSLYILEGKARILQSLIGYLLTFISYGYISLRVFTNTYGSQIGISNFIMYINSTERFFNSFSELTNSVTEIKHVANYLQPFDEFMKLKENEDIFGDIKVKDFESIEFKNVTFTYPKSDRKILDNISFKINRGEKISIVGINNAGKTTIIKLLCAFFKPDEGEILLNGLDIRKYNYDSYIDTIAVVFQDYKLFPFTINENITTDKKSTKTVEDVLKKVGLDNVIDKLEKKSYSYLDKSIYEDAVDLSGGEKQKIAIARALYKDAKLIILDEPTAALDPISESEIYENFNELVKDKTAIYISHRMSSSKFCDKILLLDEGKIKDFDTHDNLMKKDSIYKKLFNAQADNFK
ncbi:MAG TPA: ABC transporter ATP-binding protein, partial [Tissierellaceae bacterium]